jgi:hypothetical protein
VVAESPVDAQGIEAIVQQATGAAGGLPNQVGILYTVLAVVFATREDIEAASPVGDEWEQLMREVARLAYQQQPGPEHWHLPDDAFDPASVARQATDADWAPDLPNQIRVWSAGSRADALAAIKDIALQGEGVTLPKDPTGSHFQRFLSIYRGGGQIPPFPAAGQWQPCHDVPVDPAVGGDPSDPNAITQQKAQDWARLADLRYALLLGMLEQYFYATPQVRMKIRGWCIQEMRRLASLARMLVTLPRSSAAGPVAALPFSMPPLLPFPQNHAAQWQVHIDRLTAAGALITQMLQSHSAGDACLTRLTASDQQWLTEVAQIQNGTLPPEEGPTTRFDKVRQILEDATGARAPYHDGLGHFWNQPLAAFVSTVVYGQPIVAPPGPNRGQNSALVKALKGEPPFDPSGTGRMPLGGPYVSPADIAFIEQWIDDDCPNDPLPAASGGAVPNGPPGGA